MRRSALSCSTSAIRGNAGTSCSSGCSTRVLCGPGNCSRSVGTTGTRMIPTNCGLTRHSASLVWTTRRRRAAIATCTCHLESKRFSENGKHGAATAGRKPSYSRQGHHASDAPQVVLCDGAGFGCVAKRCSRPNAAHRCSDVPPLRQGDPGKREARGRQARRSDEDHDREAGPKALSEQRRKPGENAELSAQNRPPKQFGRRLLHAELLK